ncbi:MAG TPA: CorA family divalent cation transporter [Ornithinibacter sp.]|nr:CorA family divalent cation transporter [Ornithinibacter sp.]
MADVSVRVFDSGPGAPAVGTIEQLPGILASGSGWVWVDIPEPDDSTLAMLCDVFGVHPKAAADGLARNHIARLHHYRDVLYLALHRPQPGARGHVHYLELDLYLGPRFLVTLHGPRNVTVPLELLLRESADVAARVDAGRLRPASPTALLYALVSALTNVQERLVNDFAQEVGRLEQRVMSQADDDHPQEFLDELFTVRHTLLTVRTMAAQGAQVLARAATLTARAAPADAGDGDGEDAVSRLDADVLALEDLRDQYDRLARVTSSQLEFLEGATSFYRARTDTRMLIAAERLAVIAAITLPVAAISSVLGMNVVVNDRTQWPVFFVVVALMGGLSLFLLRWAKRQGWW